MTNTASADGQDNQRIWFITGASSGLGQALALAALQRGDSAVLVSRDASASAALAERFPGRALALAADVREESSIQNAVDAAITRFGRLDVIANIAGYGLFGGVEEATDRQARAIFDTNVFGVLNVLRATLPLLRSQRSGHILQGSSFYGQTAHAGVGMLAATKYAVEGLSDALAAELAPLGVAVTIVEPGPMATPFLANLAFADPLADYDQTARTVQQALSEMPAAAASIPGNAARAILAAVDAPAPPLRLALGVAAEDAMRLALTDRLAVLDDWAAITREVDAVSTSS
ncbi:MAG: SDR family NAD(P)-dependent oxidoreductase [Mycobacterium sp.]